MVRVAAQAADWSILLAAPLAIMLMVIEPPNRTTLIRRSNAAPWYQVARHLEENEASNRSRHTTSTWLASWVDSSGGAVLRKHVLFKL